MSTSPTFDFLRRYYGEQLMEADLKCSSLRTLNEEQMADYRNGLYKWHVEKRPTAEGGTRITVRLLGAEDAN